MANEELKQEISEALKNSTLSRTLGTFCATYPAKREKAYAGVDFETTRESIKRVKSYAADHIDELIDEFTKNCTARGGKVFHATSKEIAIEYIRSLVRERNVKLIVKSKSMASEELHMNKTLAEDGVLVQETDLMGDVDVEVPGTQLGGDTRLAEAQPEAPDRPFVDTARGEVVPRPRSRPDRLLVKGDSRLNDGCNLDGIGLRHHSF